MAKSALQRVVDDAFRGWQERKHPKAAREAKKRLNNSSERKRGRNVVRNLPTVEVLRELLRREQKVEARKQKTVRQRERREELRRKKVLHIPAE